MCAQPPRTMQVARSPHGPAWPTTGKKTLSMQASQPRSPVVYLSHHYIREEGRAFFRFPQARIHLTSLV
jgi:hypothetical protein